MPKVLGTRRLRAAEFLARLETGPAFGPNFDGTPFTPQQATEIYRMWARSWMVEPAKVLIPELREKKP